MTDPYFYLTAALSIGSIVATALIVRAAKAAWKSLLVDLEADRKEFRTAVDELKKAGAAEGSAARDEIRGEHDQLTHLVKALHGDLGTLGEAIGKNASQTFDAAESVTRSATTLAEAARQAVPVVSSFTTLAKVYSDHAEILRSLLVELEASRAAQEAALVSIRAGADTIKSAAAQSLSGATKQSVAAESTGLSVQALAEAVRQAQTAAENAVSASAALDGLATKLDQATRSLENTNAIELAEHITSVAKQAVDYVEQLSANARKMGSKWDSAQKRDAARDFFEKQVAAHGITLTREQVVSAHRSIESVLGAAREG